MILEGVRARDGEGDTARASGEAGIVQCMDLLLEQIHWLLAVD